MVNVMSNCTSSPPIAPLPPVLKPGMGWIPLGCTELSALGGVHVGGCEGEIAARGVTILHPTSDGELEPRRTLRRREHWRPACPPDI